jgi:hypothetical protein
VTRGWHGVLRARHTGERPEAALPLRPAPLRPAFWARQPQPEGFDIWVRGPRDQAAAI